jgi:hypothetical protein
MNREENSLDKVKPIRPGVVGNAHKQQYLDYIGQVYDDFIRNGAFHPCIILFTLVDENGDTTTNYLVPEDEKHKPSLFVGRAFVSTMAQVAEWDNVL